MGSISSLLASNSFAAHRDLGVRDRLTKQEDLLSSKVQVAKTLSPIQVISIASILTITAVVPIIIIYKLNMQYHGMW